MDTKEISRERISALADSELIDVHVNLALADLRESEERRLTWDIYHQIGDVLRSDEMAVSLSEGFFAKISARLETEPTMIAPQGDHAVVKKKRMPAVVDSVSIVVCLRKHFIPRFVMPGAAMAAAVVVVMLVTLPQRATMIANNGVTPSGAPIAMATVAVPSDAVQVSSLLAQQGEVARDPRIDDYLLAHQRFSPSMYSSAQYARAAGFTIDSDK